MKISEALQQEFRRFVEMRTGLCLAHGHRCDLSHDMAALARELHCAEIESCMRKLMAAPPTPEQTGMLARHFAVGETYFFREPGVFNALEYEVLPQLIAARRDCGKRLRLWSAGCCSGEEAYTLAILLNRLIPDIADWHITLLATDINPDFLGKARRGVYRDWSFRNLPAWVKQRYFDGREPGSYTVLPHIKQLVTFACLNLANDIYPSADSNTTGMDIVLCRNVLMYFDPFRARQVIQRLHRSLVNGGWLIVSPAEASRDLFSRFVHVHFPDAMFYRKERDQAIAYGHAPPVEGRTEEVSVPPAVAREAASGAATDRNSAASDAASRVRRKNPLALLARTHANLGQLDEARRCCEAAIAIDKSNSELRYLWAMILEEQGQPDAAMQALKQVLYLDRNFVLAHFALGSLYRRQGKAAQAARHLSDAVALLSKCAPGDMLPESGGITAGRLSEVIRATEGLS